MHHNLKQNLIGVFLITSYVLLGCVESRQSDESEQGILTLSKNDSEEEVIDHSEFEENFESMFPARDLFLLLYKGDEDYCQIEMENRKLRIKQVCSKYKETELKLHEQKMMSKDVLENLKLIESKLSATPDQTIAEFEETRRMLVCAPRKVGSTMWLYFFWEHKRKKGRNENEIFCSKYSFPQDVFTYTKAFQARHPFERLLSAYRFIFENKLPRFEIWRKPITTDIINEIPFFTNEMESAKTYYNYSLTFGAKSSEDHLTPTFRQFCEFLVKRGLNFGREYYGSIVDHWMPYFITCNPCNPDFEPDFIIRMETILKDTLCFLDSVPNIGWTDLEGVMPANQAPGSHSSSKFLQKQYFSTITQDSMMNLYQLYKLDFLMYDYNIENFLPLAKTC